MAPRALGALLAIVAAVAFAVSIASSAWWAGHPTVQGQTIHAKDVAVGPLGATGCNTGGDGSCEPLATSGTVKLVGLGAVAAIGLAILFSFMLAVSAWRVGDRRAGLATATIVATLIAAGVGIALLALGPGIEATQHIAVPLGWGTYVFGGAVVSSLIASAITRKLEREPLRLKSGVAPPAPAPQLRPLYDPTNQGFVPIPQSPALPLQPPAPYPREEVKALTGQYTPTPEQVNPLGSPNPGVRKSPTSPPPLRAETSRAKAPSVAPPVSRAPVPSPRTQSPGAPSRPKSPSTPPRPPLPNAQSSAPRAQPPVAAPRASVTSDPAPSTGRKTPGPQRGRTELGTGTDPSVPKLDTPAAPAALRPSAPTIAHAVPPMPTPDNQAPPSVLAARDVTAVEVDSEAKAVAKATAQGQLDPRIAKRTPRSATDARTGQHEVAIADVTSTGVDVESAPRSAATTSENLVASPPAASQRIITGENRALSTKQRHVARAATEDPFESGKAHVLVPAGELSEELYPERNTESVVAQEAPVTDAHSIPSAQELADELSSQSAAGSIGDVTAATAPPIDVLEYDRRNPTPETTPIPTFHGPRTTSASMSTASATLPPPRTVESAPHGPTPACPQCESPMAWVEEHLRFYCKQCRMYF